MQFIKLLLAVLVAFTSYTSAARRPGNSVLLSGVKSLTVHDGKKTSARRVSAIPQLACVGGNAKGLYNVDVMRCKNAGSEYDTEDIQWTCQASLPPEFKLGSTEVICEGYDSPDDPYILKGSCGVEYRLVLTDLGEEKYGKNAFERAYRDPSRQNVFEALAATLFWAAFIGIAGFIIYKVFFANNQPNARGPNNRRRGGGFGGFGGGGGGGGGGDDGHDDPPPPYTPRAPKPASSYRANQAPSQGSSGAWNPGFWTGAATGAAAGYAASALGGGRNANRGYQYDPPQPGPSNWFGRTRDPQPAFGGGAGRSSLFGGAGPSSSSASPSSSRYESTGFGGTRRR